MDLKLTLARRIFDAAGHAELKVSCLRGWSEDWEASCIFLAVLQPR